jgi:hypothetical protein
MYRRDSGFLNGIIAYGVAFINSPHLESWRILFLIEGLLTVMVAVVGLILLPENIDTCRFLNAEEKDYRACYVNLKIEQSLTSSQVRAIHVDGPRVERYQLEARPGGASAMAAIPA